MEMTPATHQTLMLPVSESNEVGECRRRAAALARRLGFDANREGRLALVVTELATNLVRYAKQGEILIQARPMSHSAVIEVISVDHGPGMADFEQCAADGFSTSGSVGGGLGAVRRASDQCEAYNQPGRGLVLLSRIWATAGEASGGLVFGGICIPKPGQGVCGDGWSCEQRDGAARLTVTDGLGHGPFAAASASAALAAISRSGFADAQASIQAAHDALRGLRGAALVVADVDQRLQMARFQGVGNVAGRVILNGRTHHVVSRHGTVGVEVPTLIVSSAPWRPGAVLVLHTDGLASRWRMEDYPGLSRRDPSVIAAVLYRDHARGRDDVTVVVARADAGDTEQP